MKIQGKLLLALAISSAALNSIQASLTDTLGQDVFQAAQIVGLSAAMGGLFNVTEMTAMFLKYRSQEDPLLRSWEDYKESFHSGARKGVRFGLSFAAFSRVGWGHKLEAQHIIKPMTAAFGALFVTSRVSEGINYSRGYNNPILANAVMDRNSDIAQKWLRRPINAEEDKDVMVKHNSASLVAYDYNRSLMPKVAVALGGGVLLYTAYQRYQNT